MRWAAIWQDGWPLIAPSPGADRARRLPELTLCLELVVPPRKPRQTLRLWQGEGPKSEAIALYLQPDGCLRLVHRKVDLSTAPDFARAGDTVTLRYRACARGRTDVAAFDNADRGLRERLRAAAEQPLRLSDALPRDLRFLAICHIAAIAPFGVPPTDMPGVAAGTSVMTPKGPARIETLQIGDAVVTSEGEAAPIRWIEARPRLNLGRLAPIRLRAPYFGLVEDLCVTPETRILRHGPTVEYIFGTEQVLVHARDLLSSGAAIRDQQKPVDQVFHLMLDDHACIQVDRCAVETALLADVVSAEDMGPRPHLAESDTCPVVPILDRASAQALVAAASKGRQALG